MAVVLQLILLHLLTMHMSSSLRGSALVMRRRGNSVGWGAALSSRATQLFSTRTTKAALTPPTAATFLMQDTQQLAGVGPIIANQLKKLGIHSIRDLLLYFPRSMNRRIPSTLSACETGSALYVIRVQVEEVIVRGKQVVMATCKDADGTSLQLVYFTPTHPAIRLLRQHCTARSYVSVSGKLSVSKYDGQLQMVQADVLSSEISVPLLEPVYALTEGITSAKMRTLVVTAISALKTHGLGEWLASDFLSENGWPGCVEAIEKIHFPSVDDVVSLARDRLAFDELAAAYLSDLEAAVDKDFSLSFTKALTVPFLKSLPFKMTPSQLSAFEEVKTDLSKPAQMRRILQGDVGSGKTVVAFLGLLLAVEGRRMGALLAPTSLLANQHFADLTKYLDAAFSGKKEALRPRVKLCTSNMTAKARSSFQEELETGGLDIVVGTHAILRDAVSSALSPRLGLVVIDEEQRFGVKQRGVMAHSSNVLYTTATPIPRSQAMVYSEDLMLSTLSHMPPGKRAIATKKLSLDHVEELIVRIGVVIGEGTKVFWVCPALEPSSAMPGSSAMERHDQLLARFPGQVLLLHGSMSNDDKISVMAQFMAGAGSVLVATTIVEVGVNVPDASICVIDRAERFGLSTVHQIRGRIGRGAPPPGEDLGCHCVLLHSSSADADPDQSTRLDKLQILVDNTDGFEIAKHDYEHRKEGDQFGTSQHGSSEYRAVLVPDHYKLFPVAKAAAVKLMRGETGTYVSLLKSPEINALRSLFSASTSTSDAIAEDKGAGSIALPTRRSSYKHVTTDYLGDDASLFASALEIVDNVQVSTRSRGLDVLYVIFDLETTGFSPENDCIIQVAAKQVGNSDTPFNRYVRPEKQKISPKIEEITGITQEFVDTNGHSISSALGAFQQWLRAFDRPLCLMSHNGKKFDELFMDAEFKRIGVLNWAKESNVVGFVDTMQLLRHKRIRGPHFSPLSFNQQKLYTLVMGTPPLIAHNAVADVEALEAILARGRFGAPWKTIAEEIVRTPN